MVCSEETFQLGHMSNLYLTISLDTTWTFFKYFINFFILINLLLFYLFYIINDLLPVTSTFPKLGKNNAGFFPLDTLHSSLCVYLLVRVKRGKEEKKEESEEAMTME